MGGFVQGPTGGKATKGWVGRAGPRLRGKWNQVRMDEPMSDLQGPGPSQLPAPGSGSGGPGSCMFRERLRNPQPPTPGCEPPANWIWSKLLAGDVSVQPSCLTGTLFFRVCPSRLPHMPRDCHCLHGAGRTFGGDGFDGRVRYPSQPHPGEIQSPLPWRERRPQPSRPRRDLPCALAPRTARPSPHLCQVPDAPVTSRASRT